MISNHGDQRQLNIISSEFSPELIFTEYDRQYLSQCMARKIAIDPLLLNQIYQFFDMVCDSEKLNVFLANYQSNPNDAKYAVWLLKKYYIFNLFKHNDKIPPKRKNIETELIHFCQLHSSGNTKPYKWYDVVDAYSLAFTKSEMFLDELASTNNIPDVCITVMIELFNTPNDRITNHDTAKNNFKAAVNLIKHSYRDACEILFNWHRLDNLANKPLIQLYTDFCEYATKHLMSQINFEHDNSQDFILSFTYYIHILHLQKQLSMEMLEELLAEEKSDIKMMILIKSARLWIQNYSIELVEILYTRAFEYFDSMEMQNPNEITIFEGEAVTIQDIASYFNTLLGVKSDDSSVELFLASGLLTKVQQHSALIYHVGCMFDEADTHLALQCFEALQSHYSDDLIADIDLKYQLIRCYQQLSNNKWQGVFGEIISMDKKINNINVDTYVHALKFTAYKFSSHQMILAIYCIEKAISLSNSDVLNTLHTDYFIKLISDSLKEHKILKATQLMERWLKYKNNAKDELQPIQFSQKESNEENVINQFFDCLKQLNSAIPVYKQLKFIYFIIEIQIHSNSLIENSLNVGLNILSQYDFKNGTELLSRITRKLDQASKFEQLIKWQRACNVLTEQNNVIKVKDYLYLSYAIDQLFDYSELQEIPSLIIKAYKLALERDGMDFVPELRILDDSKDNSVLCIFNTMYNPYLCINNRPLNIFSTLRNLYQSQDRSTQHFVSLYIAYFQNKELLRSEEIELLKITCDFFEKVFINSAENENDSLITKNWKFYFKQANNKKRFTDLQSDINRMMEVKSLQKQITSDPAIVAFMLLDMKSAIERKDSEILAMKSDILKLQKQVQSLSKNELRQDSISSAQGLTIFSTSNAKNDASDVNSVKSTNHKY